MGDAEAGALLAAEFVGGFCGAMASGWLGRRWTLLTALRAGLTLFALGLVGAAVAVKWWMPVCMLGCGFGLGVINPMANLIVSRASFPSPAAALNLFSFSWAAGALSTPFVIAFVLRFEPVAYVFAALAIITVVVALGATMVKTGEGSLEGERASPQTNGELRRGTTMFVVITGVLLFLYVGVETGISVWLPTGTGRWLPVTASDAAASQSAFWGSLLLGRLLAPVWLRRISPHALILAGLLCGAAGIAVFLIARSYGSVLVGVILAGLGLAPVNPTIVATFTRRLGSASARWAGPVFASAALGGASIPWAVGEVSSRLNSLRTGFVVPLLCIGSMFFLELGLRSEPPQER